MPVAFSLKISAVLRSSHATPYSARTGHLQHGRACRSQRVHRHPHCYQCEFDYYDKQCPSGQTSLPASPTAGKSTASTPSATTGDDPTGHGPGCAASNVKIPVGAQTVTTADLDHDGRADKLFLQHNTSELGVHTASGDTFSRKFAVSEASEVGAQAFVVADGSSLVLLSGSRQSYLFAVVDCALVVTKTFKDGHIPSTTGSPSLARASAAPTTRTV